MLINKFGCVVWVAVFLLMSNQGWADDKKKPIKVKARQMESVGFSRLVVRPGKGFEIGIASDEFGVTIIEQMRRAGYNALGAENLVFGVDKGQDARMLLGGTINEFKCYRFKDTSWAPCDIAITWELFDKKRNMVIYRVTTRDRRNFKKKEFDPDDSYKLVFGSLQSLLSRQRFVDAMKKKAAPITAITSAAAQYRRCEMPEVNLPEDMNAVMDATVFIETSSGVGSGFFFSKDGLILTANHVVEGASFIRIKTKDKIESDAVVVRTDKENDVAVLKASLIYKSCLPLAGTLPDPGSDIFAIGAPEGEELSFSVSKGIVSAIRFLEGQQVLQTDAAINPGNSGGPLLNRKGQAVAIVKTVKVSSFGLEGLAFGVPAKKAIDKLALKEADKTTVAAGQMVKDKSEEKWPIVDRNDPRKENPELAVAMARKKHNNVEKKVNRRVIGGSLLLTGGLVVMATSGLVFASRELDDTKRKSIGGMSLVAGAGLATLGIVVFASIPKLRRKLMENPNGNLSILPMKDGLFLSYGASF